MNARIVNLEQSLGPSGAAGEELAVAGVVVQAAALSEPASYALVSVKTNDVLVTFDGTDPVAAGAGCLLEKGYLEVWPKRRLAAAKFINLAGGSAGVVRVEPLVEW